MKSGFAESRPLMLLLDPNGNAAGIVARWEHSADRFGWIVTSTPAIKNGNNTDQDMLHLLALLDAVAAKWPVDRRAVILGGFSGGGCGAYRHTLSVPTCSGEPLLSAGIWVRFRISRIRYAPVRCSSWQLESRTLMRQPCTLWRKRSRTAVKRLNSLNCPEDMNRSQVRMPTTRCSG